MPIEQEHDTGNIQSPENSRDSDLKTLSAVNSLVDPTGGMHLIITGSYSIEGLTGNQLEHRDIDANIFSSNPKVDQARMAVLMNNISVLGVSAHLFKETEDRLEYELSNPQGEPRMLELQFVEAQSTDESNATFNLKNGGVVPVVDITLRDSKGQEFSFRTKSLEYSIATWAIRISGAATNPKREVKDSDLHHLRLLLSGNFNKEDVISAMKQHPQMPENLSEGKVLRYALEKLNV